MKAGRIGLMCAVVVIAQAWKIDASAEPMVRQSGEVSYVTGGVGLEEREALTRQSADFNLKVVNAVPGRPYVSDINIAVVDSKGQEVLRTVSDGPWLLARLPAGRYTVNASDGTRTQTRTVQVSNQGQREVMLRWSDFPVNPPPSRPIHSTGPL